MRFRTSLVSSALISCGLVWLGCSSDEPAPAAPEEAKDAGTGKDAKTSKGDSEGPVSLEPYRIVGRYDDSDPEGPKFDWSGTQIIAKFKGATISVDLSDTMKDGENVNQFDVVIDDGEPTILTIDSAEKKTYELASGLDAKEHTLVLTRRTEAFMGVTQLFKINAELTGTPPPPSRRIELVGDSITAGYGVLGKDETCNFSNETENEVEAWGSVAAKALNASHTAIAWSGIGVYISIDGETDKQMPELYKRTLGSVDESPTWTTSKYEPDVVVIALGTNDLDDNHDDPGDEYEKALVKFVGDVREAHANAHIVLATSPMMEGDHKATQKSAMEGIVEKRKGEGDTKLSVLDVPTQKESDGLGCDYHPSKKTQQKMGTALTEHLKSTLGW